MAQFAASVTGTVEDAAGAEIPGATVTLTNTGTQQKFTAITSSDGSYRFTTLPPATYVIHVAANGFKAYDISHVEVLADTPRNLDVKLDIGGTTESVTVNADNIPLLQTNDGQIQRTLTSDDIQRLPAFGADPYELLRTAPGITGDGARSGTGGAIFLPNNAGPGGSNSGIFQTENQIQISADGQRVADNNILIDGVSVNSLTHGGSAVVTPSQESVANITVISTSYDAGDGRNTGAQVKTTTKSGQQRPARLAVLPLQRARARRIQPLWRPCAWRDAEPRSHQAAHLRRVARWPDHQEQGLSFWLVSGLHAGQQHY